MMTVVPFDTHEVVKELKAAGFTDEQAEAVTRVMRKAQDIDLSNLATKADLQIGLGEVRNEIHGTRTEILKWVISSMGVQTVVILGTVVALARLAIH